MILSIKKTVKEIVSSGIECIFVKDFSYDSGSSVDFESLDDFIQFCKNHDVKTTFYCPYGNKDDDNCKCQFFSSWNSMHIGFIVNEEAEEDCDVDDETNDDDEIDDDDYSEYRQSIYEAHGIVQKISNIKDFNDRYTKMIFDSKVLTHYNSLLLHTKRSLYDNYSLELYPELIQDNFDEEKQLANDLLEKAKIELNQEDDKKEKMKIGEAYDRKFKDLIRSIFTKKEKATTTLHNMRIQKMEQRKKDMIEIPKLIQQEVSNYPDLKNLKTKASIEKYADQIKKTWKDEKKYDFLTLKQIKYIIEEEIERIN